MGVWSRWGPCELRHQLEKLLKFHFNCIVCQINCAINKISDIENYRLHYSISKENKNIIAWTFQSTNRRTTSSCGWSVTANSMLIAVQRLAKERGSRFIVNGIYAVRFSSDAAKSKDCHQLRRRVITDFIYWQSLVKVRLVLIVIILLINRLLKFGSSFELFFVHYYSLHVTSGLPWRRIKTRDNFIMIDLTDKLSRVSLCYFRVSFVELIYPAYIS